jgi:hypothetical protein
VPGLEPAVALDVRERERERRGRRVPVLGDAVDDAIGRQAQPLTDRGQNPPVRLVVDEQVDVVEWGAA